MNAYTTLKQNIRGLSDVTETIKVTERIAASMLNSFKAQKMTLDEHTLALTENLQRLLQFYSGKHPLLKSKENGKKMLITITGDKGLVGDYYHEIISVLLSNRQNYQEYISIGEKGSGLLQEENIALSVSIPVPDLAFKSEDITPPTAFIFDKFKQGDYKEIHVLYSRFHSLGYHEPVIIKLLPFEFANDILQKSAGENNTYLGLPIFDTAKKDIFHYLLEKYIHIFFYHICMEARLSELAARIMAMENAKEKTKELTARYLRSYYKDRAMVITTKQLESFTVHKARYQ